MKEKYLIFAKKEQKWGHQQKSVSLTNQKTWIDFLTIMEAESCSSAGGDFCFYQAQDFPGEPEWDSSIPLMEKPI